MCHFLKIALSILLLLPINMMAKTTPSIYKSVDQTKMNQWVDSVFNKLSEDEKIGQLFTMIVAGNNSASNKKRIATLVSDNKIGGILFSKISIQDHIELTNYAQSLATTPLLVTLDGEWGLSMRIANTTPWPRNMMLGAIQNDSLLYYYGKEVARQCREMGIHVNFSPDIDVNTNPNNPVIGSRSFGENPQRVAKAGVMYSKGLEAGKVLSVAKHFPGHGDTSTDSHKTLPLINHSMERLENYELVPFKEYINQGLGGMMIGHLNIPVLDNTNQPSSLSDQVIQKLLIDKLGFEGLVFTDGMQMKGVSTEKDHSLRAILAGNDIVLSPLYITPEIASVKAALTSGDLPKETLNAKVKKILAYKYILGVTSKTATYVDNKDIANRLNTAYADWLNRKLNENAMTLLKNDDDILPLKSLDKRKIAAISIDPGPETVFLDRLKDYTEVTSFDVKDIAECVALKAKLKDYDTVILGIHSRKLINVALLNDVFKDKELILAFFVYPYELKKYKSIIESSTAVVLGYEDSRIINDYVAEGIFGGRAFKGKLPVTIDGVFSIGTGLDTKKTRLAYGIPEEVNVSSFALNKIDSIVNVGINELAYPGAQVLVAKNGVVIYKKAFGTVAAKDRAVTNEDIYDLASMSKASGTLPAIMKLHSDKKLTLSDPISNYVVELKDTDKSDITIRDALLHETGLVAYIPYYTKAIDTTSYKGNLFSRKNTDLYTLQFDQNTYAQPFKFRASLVSDTPKDNFLQMANNLYINKAYGDTIVQMIADSKLRNNKNYTYSCLNFMLLKEVSENIVNFGMDKFLQTYIYSKLGAYRTMYNPLNKYPVDQIVPTEQDDFLRKQLVRGTVHDEGAALMGGVSGNAGLFSTANDLAKLYQMYLNNGTYGGEVLLDPNTVKLFTKSTSNTSRRGLGFDKPEPRLTKGSPTSPSTSVSTYGHTGFTGTCFWVDPDTQLIYIFLSNRVYPKRYPNQLSKLATRSLIQEQIYKAIAEGRKNKFVIR